MDTGNNFEAAPTTEAAPSASATQDTQFKVWRPPRAGQAMAHTSGMDSIYATYGTKFTAAATGELPDSYFEPTTGEIMALHQSRVAERERLVDAPLKTSIIREREEKQREARYPTVNPTFSIHRAEVTCDIRREYASSFLTRLNSSVSSRRQIKFGLYMRSFEACLGKM
jgi:hypothetical protein